MGTKIKIFLKYVKRKFGQSGNFLSDAEIQLKLFAKRDSYMNYDSINFF